MTPNAARYGSALCADPGGPSLIQARWRLPRVLAASKRLPIGILIGRRA
jgi:hypothetical protein